MNKNELEILKNTCDSCYAIISSATDCLKRMQEICPHVNEKEGLYSWRVGCIDEAVLCDDCGVLIRYKNPVNIKFD